MRRCNECKNRMLCTICNNEVNKNKEIKANLNLIQRQTPIEFGHMLLHLEEQDHLFVIKNLNINSFFAMFY